MLEEVVQCTSLDAIDDDFIVLLHSLMKDELCSLMCNYLQLVAGNDSRYI